VLITQRDSMDSGKSGAESETDVREAAAELEARDAEVWLSAEARCPLSGGYRIPITYTGKKL
jgi:hypothetical protein